MADGGRKAVAHRLIPPASVPSLGSRAACQTKAFQRKPLTRPVAAAEPRDQTSEALRLSKLAEFTGPSVACVLHFHCKAQAGGFRLANPPHLDTLDADGGNSSATARR